MGGFQVITASGVTLHDNAKARVYQLRWYQLILLSLQSMQNTREYVKRLGGIIVNLQTCGFFSCERLFKPIFQRKVFTKLALRFSIARKNFILIANFITFNSNPEMKNVWYLVHSTDLHDFVNQKLQVSVTPDYLWLFRSIYKGLVKVPSHGAWSEGPGGFRAQGRGKGQGAARARRYRNAPIQVFSILLQQVLKW